jgi:formylmethanofuran dehydrogenase subunit C
LNIGSDFTYVSGTFTSSTGTVSYNGAAAQNIAPVTYRNLTINKSGGTATLSSSATVTNDLTVTVGTFSTSANIAVSGNISIASGATLNGGAATISLGGNWSNSGTFSSGTGTINLNGGVTQSIAATTFNNLTVNKHHHQRKFDGHRRHVRSRNIHGE